jgi:glycosyltransferase involved in cell wall biosynthesis
VYQAAGFVAETLHSIQQQSFREFRVLVSVDRSHDDSEAICRAFESDERFAVTAQPERLGWVRNVNFLLDRVTTEYFVLLFHDDLWHKDYLTILSALLREERGASVAYTSMDRFGMTNDPFPCRPYPGTPFERVHSYLSGAFHVIPIRGLLRSELFNGAFRLRDYEWDGFLAERIGVFEILCAGQGLYYPEPLYRKRIIRTSVVRTWAKWSNEQKLDAWAAHHAAFVNVINGTRLSAEEKQKLREVLPQHITTLGDATRDALSVLVRNR